MKSIYLGIDISKKTLDICLLDKSVSTFYKISNTIKNIDTFFKKIIKKHTDIFVAMENTGYYNDYLYQVLAHTQCKVYVIDPKHIKRSIGLVRGKNDKVDAKRIAVFIERNHQDFQCWKPVSEQIKSMKILLSQRNHKIKLRSGLKQQNSELKMLTKTKAITKIIQLNQQQIRQLNYQIATLEHLIQLEINQDVELKRNIIRILSIPGIGKITAWTIAVKTNGFTRLTNPRKLACFAGVVPFEQQSGTSLKTKPRVSKMADSQLKTTLQMAAMRAVRMENELKFYYEKKVKQGKNKMSVLNAVRNKLLHIAMAVIRNQTFYQNRLF
ncbi:transposase, partial [Kordia periserrulae]